VTDSGVLGRRLVELVYDLRTDGRRIESAKNIAPDPATYGSEEWWSALDTPALPLHRIEGRLAHVYWASMGDWPEFALADAAGAVTTWTRMGDVSRYVEGLNAAVEYVIVSFKDPFPIPGMETLGLPDEHPDIVRVFVEASDLRSDPRAPGPGGVGLR
jgi:hypothetical protein